MRLVKLLGLGVLVVVLTIAISKIGPVGLAQADCTVIVKPGESIQKTIDAAHEGAVICLEEGAWEEEIDITKGLTLRGAGLEKTKLVSKAGIYISSSLKGAVSLERLTITGGSLQNILIFGTTKVNILDSRVSGSNEEGIRILGPADVTITNSHLLENKGYGIYMQESGQVTIVNSRISNNGAGIFMMNLYAFGAIKATIIDSQITANRWEGITLGGVREAEAQAEIKNSLIQDNGTSEDCKKKEFACDGINMYFHAYVKLIGSNILNNADWGISSMLKQCGADEDVFWGHAVFESMELADISGNNVTGNQKGMGNPGNHPWNRPGVPDGQVCLP